MRTALLRLVLGATLLTCLPALAETRRLAVLVGHNVGSGERPALRYAESDAGKLAQVLTELGDVAPADLFLLQGRGLSALQQVLAQVGRRVEAWRTEPGVRVVLLFYYSGHSDGVALELGRERLAFGALRGWLDATGAHVRLAILDSCRSGALLRAKGGRPGPAFDIRLADELASSGQALLTSSAEDELALESREIGGSFFTHHLVSGLRGAADTSRDGRVTLAEAYQYAYTHTVSATVDTFTGGQHPAYDYRLSGQGELILTQLESPGGALELPPGYERALVVHPQRDMVLAELPAGAIPRLALPPGEYAVRAWRGGRAHAGRVRLAAGELRRVRWEELAVEGVRVATAKGGPPAAPARPAEPLLRLPLEVVLGGGVRRTVAHGLSPMPVLHAALHGAGHTGPLLAFELGTAERGLQREDAMQLLVGYRFGHALGPLTLFGGPELAGQYVRQRLGSVEKGWSLTPSLAPAAGLSLRLSSHVSLELEGRVPLTVLRRDGQLALEALPGARLALAFRPR